jgi:hypothetical protein
MTQQRGRWRIIRFSLRASLIALALPLILLGWYANQVQMRQRLVSSITSNGGSVWYDCEVNASLFQLPAPESREPQWAERLLGKDWFHHVAVVDLGSGVSTGGLRDDDLNRLARLPKLKKLVLRDATQVTPAGIASLSRLQNLEWLYLHRPQITGPELRPLRDLPRLSNLSVSTPLGNAGLAELAQFPALTELEVCSDGMTDDGIRQLKLLGKLTRLELSGDYRVGPALSQELRNDCPQLNIDDGSFRDWSRQALTK